ncbi:MAG: type III-A CRISPR-associated protein Cas10/Csm1 [bacterium]|nr:type III-A CRISPR-associated protein Cas10/Csm1 [bacterium]
MTDTQIKIIVGSLLHDIGKVVYRGGDGRNHSESGYQYLKDEVGIQDKEVLNCVRYHHGANLKTAHLNTDAIAYLTYYADNVAAATDRRQKENPEYGFDKKIPLSSVFNLLNGRNGTAHFEMQRLNSKSAINYPTDQPIQMREDFYREVIRDITDCLKNMKESLLKDDAYLNSLLTVLESNLSYIPSSTSRKELADISLYDHMKLTAAIAACMEQWLSSQGKQDYYTELFVDAQKTYEKKTFLLYSLDVSGIQKFIYTISSEGALKGLRSRSFYLELLMEFLIDELLQRLSLSRTNLIYAGGGHCYMLLPNTEQVSKILAEFEAETNYWFETHYDIALYIAGGSVACSAMDLKNEPEGCYPELYRTISRMQSKKKTHRYNAQEILALNRMRHKGERECKICRRTGKIDTNGCCKMCAALLSLSSDVLYQNFFVILDKEEKESLELPFGRYLQSVASEKDMRVLMRERPYVRIYTKNKEHMGKFMSTNLWVGSYAAEPTFEQLAKKAEGIERLGVLRADIDNLGKAFVDGFMRDGSSKFMSLSRTAAMSRQLSLFFKCYINRLLEEGNETFLNGKKKRSVAIVYSGGDDVFLVGAWNEVIEAFADLRKAFQRFTGGALTISGGIGFYTSSYPIHLMAAETELLESAAKALPTKNGISVFSEEHTYEWNRFMEK